MYILFTLTVNTLICLLLQNYFWDLRTFNIRYFKTFTQLLFIWELFTFIRYDSWTFVTALNVIEYSIIHNPVRPSYTLQHNVVYCISAIFTSRFISTINHYRHLFHFWFSMVLFFLKKGIQKNVCTIVCVYWYKTHNYKRYIRVKNQTLWGDRGSLNKVLYVAANVAISHLSSSACRISPHVSASSGVIFLPISSSADLTWL